jgi:hypothetical protein
VTQGYLGEPFRHIFRRIRAGFQAERGEEGHIKEDFLFGTVDQDADADDMSLILISEGKDFPKAEARGKDIVYDEGAGSFREGGAPSERSLVLGIPFGIKRLGVELACHLIGDEGAPYGRSYHHLDAVGLEMLDDGFTEACEEIGSFQDAELLKVDIAVPAGGEQEMPLLDSPDFFQRVPEVIHF